MAETPTSQPYEFPVNQRLLEESLKLKEERQVLKQRLEKIDTSHGKVSSSVYERVRQDYLSRFQDTNEKLLQKKQDVDHELATLYETKEKIENNLRTHKETLEETEFRYQLGEYSQEEFKRRAKGEQEKIAKFESILTGVSSSISRYESIFQGEEDLFGEAPSLVGPEMGGDAEDVWEQEAQAIGPITDDSITGGSVSSASISSETTKPQIEVRERPARPQLTIIAGRESVGKSFPIQGTLSLGRSQANHITLKDAKVSRQHAEIQNHGEQFVLLDLNSSNGTFVNGHKINEQVLSHGDEIQIGDFILQFQS